MSQWSRPENTGQFLLHHNPNLIATPTPTPTSTPAPPFTAEPSTFDFQGTSWKVGSAEIVNEFRHIKPESASDVLLVVTLDIEGKPFPSDQGMALAVAFFEITLKDSNRYPGQINTGLTEDGKFINQVECVFAVEKGTRSVEILLPDSQIIKITVNP